MADPTRVQFVVAGEDAGRRLDQVLAARVPGLSRRQARVLLDIGGVFIDRQRVKIAGRPVHAGEQIVAHLGGALARATKRVGTEARAADEQTLPPVAVVFEDDDIIVVDKPSGLLTAPTPESDRNNLVSLLSRRAVPAQPQPETQQPPQAPPPRQPPLVVHRLDLETSGLLVLAKSELANRVLAERFRTHDLTREYLAGVAGAFPDGLTRIDRPVGGRRAVTHVAVVDRLGPLATFLRCRLETGRTHQIRLHVTAAGHPVLGDARYGAGPTPGVPRPPRMALHATVLAFAHPRSGAGLSFESPWPPEMAAWIAALPRAAAPAQP